MGFKLYYYFRHFCFIWLFIAGFISSHVYAENYQQTNSEYQILTETMTSQSALVEELMLQESESAGLSMSRQLGRSYQQGDANLADIHQSGMNRATGVQIGSYNQQSIVQSGSLNQSLNLQNGDDLSANLVQNGEQNIALLLQLGEGHIANIQQNGLMNSALVQQWGSGNTATVYQNGYGQKAMIKQVGHSLNVQVVQSN